MADGKFLDSQRFPGNSTTNSSYFHFNVIFNLLKEVLCGKSRLFKFFLKCYKTDLFLRRLSSLRKKHWWDMSNQISSNKSLSSIKPHRQTCVSQNNPIKSSLLVPKWKKSWLSTSFVLEQIANNIKLIVIIISIIIWQ